MQDLRDITTGSDPGLGGVLSGSSVSGTGSIASAFSSWPPWDMYSVADCSSDVGGLMVTGPPLVRKSISLSASS